jgi:hypothetical protein
VQSKPCDSVIIIYIKVYNLWPWSSQKWLPTSVVFHAEEGGCRIRSVTRGQATKAPVNGLHILLPPWVLVPTDSQLYTVCNSLINTCACACLRACDHGLFTIFIEQIIRCINLSNWIKCEGDQLAALESTLEIKRSWSLWYSIIGHLVFLHLLLFLLIIIVVEAEFNPNFLRTKLWCCA